MYVMALTIAVWALLVRYPSRADGRAEQRYPGLHVNSSLEMLLFEVELMAPCYLTGGLLYHLLHEVLNPVKSC